MTTTPAGPDYADLFAVAAPARDAVTAAFAHEIAGYMPTVRRRFLLGVHLQTVISAYASLHAPTGTRVAGAAAGDLTAELADAIAALVVGVAQQFVPVEDGVEADAAEAVERWLGLVATHVARRLASAGGPVVAIDAQLDGTVGVSFPGAN